MANPPFNVNGVDKDKLAGRSPLPLRHAPHRQRQLPLDPDVLLRPERHRPRRFRHGQFRLRRPRQRAGDPQAAPRRPRRSMSWSPSARTSSTPSPCPAPSGSSTRASATPTAPTRSSSSTPAHIYRQIDRAHRDFTPRPDRVHRQHRPPLPRRGTGDGFWE